MSEARKKMLQKQLPDYCEKCNLSNTTQRRRYRKEMRKMVSESALQKIKNKIKFQ